MPLVRAIRSRGATVYVEVHGEALFTPVGEIGRFTNRLSNAITLASRKAAPSNKRPRWMHYGETLKKSITSHTVVDPAQMRVHGVVGSRVSHSLFVDQGTEPFEAKLLPPWEAKGYRFFERSQFVGNSPGRRKGTRLVSGQKARYFFDEGTRNGMRAMGLSARPSPGSPQSEVSFARAPTTLPDFVVGTYDNGLFEAQRDIWRADYSKEQEAIYKELRERQFQMRLMKAQSDRLAAEAREREAKAQQIRDNRKAIEDAIEKRKEAQERELIAAEEAKEIGKEKAAEKAKEQAKYEAAQALRLGNAEMKRLATQYLRKIRQQYPDASLGTKTLADGVIVYQVRFTVGGEVHRQRWAYGYGIG